MNHVGNINSDTKINCKQRPEDWKKMRKTLQRRYAFTLNCNTAAASTAHFTLTDPVFTGIFFQLSSIFLMQEHKNNILLHIFGCNDRPPAPFQSSVRLLEALIFNITL